MGGTLENREAAMTWVRWKENKPPKTPAKPGYMTLISESRMVELRALKSPDFDFQKLIRICEELNTAFQEECYFATAMLTRGLLDHAPPVFGFKTFSEVANNYAGGGKSFKETMQHLENAARKVADVHLHMPIRKSETLPVSYTHLDVYKRQVYQHAGLCRKYFLAMLENQNVGLGPLPKEPEYGARQPEVTQAMMEAWNWLEREGMLIRNPQQPSGEWFTISRSGEKLLQQYAREQQWENLGVDVVKHDLMNGGCLLYTSRCV